MISVEKSKASDCNDWIWPQSLSLSLPCTPPSVSSCGRASAESAVKGLTLTLWGVHSVAVLSVLSNLRSDHIHAEATQHQVAQAWVGAWPGLIELDQIAEQSGPYC